MPGVKQAGEGNTGFYVRGGGLDQNLILLDEAPVYNASHLLGFFFCLQFGSHSRCQSTQRINSGGIWRSCFIGIGYPNEGRKHERI